MMEDRRELLRKIPKIDEVLQDERLFFFTESTPRAVIVDSVREVIDELRKDILELSLIHILLTSSSLTSGRGKG